MASAPRPVPTRYGDRDVYAVSQLNRGVASWVSRLPAVWVEGEATEVRRQDGWGRAYWTLKDVTGAASVRVRMLRAAFDRLPHPIRDGDRLHIHGRVSVYEKTAELTLEALIVEPWGVGTLLAQLERLKATLAKEGLFDTARKRPLPRFPRLIGLVCGRDAAAKHDVIEHAVRRYPPAQFRVVECAVQGPGAPAQVVSAIRSLAGDDQVDVIVVTRGGGSLEDLAAFSDERVCRAIAASPVPVVTAIGHEQDTPICDLVADVRASTPTHAARLVVPDAAALAQDAARLVARAQRAFDARLRRERAWLSLITERPVLRKPEGFLDVRRDGLVGVAARLAAAQRRRLETERTLLVARAAQLRALGPAATLDRGYAIALSGGGHVISDAARVAVGERVTVRVARGALVTTVEEVETCNNPT